MQNASTENISFDSPEDVRRYLDSLPSFQVHGAVAARLGLDRIREFCAKMGNPQHKMPCIHVAGTNGKGSVSAMLALVYEQAGYRCGLFSSPHLEHVTERIRIDRRPIPEEYFLRFFQRFGDELQHSDLSYFEITTAAAFWWFADQKADIVILETGLGGRLDATNIVTPELSVITSIAHDHQNFLGRTLAEIAREKGGIIKPGRPLVLGKVPPEAQKVLVEMAGKCGSDVHDVRMLYPRHRYRSREGRPESVFRIREEGKTRDIVSDLMAPVHRWNIAMTWLAVRLLKPVFPISEDVFLHAFENAATSGLFRARFERLHPRLPWYFDGAHNPEAVKELLHTIRRQEWEQSPVMVMSLMKDKAQKKMLQPFSVFSKNYYYGLEMERAADIALITPYLANLQSLPPNEDEITEIFAGLTKQVVIFTGSFYFYGVVKRWISRIIKAD